MTRTFWIIVYYMLGIHLQRQGDVDDEWGRSESIDPDNVGDIADEGAFHRGRGQWGV